MQNSIGLPGDINNDTSSGDQLGFFFPWYGSDISSLSQGFNISSGFNASHELSSAFSSFRGFYANPGPEPAQRIGDTPVIIQTSMKGYDVTFTVPFWAKRAPAETISTYLQIQCSQRADAHNRDLRRGK
jgi:hypothetical protein